MAEVPASTPAPTQAYLETLLLYYEEEVEGEAYFEALAPPEDLPRLKLLTAHEVAAVAFLDLELWGKPDSVGPMNAYLEKGIV